jgi:hypothetical protein
MKIRQFLKKLQFQIIIGCIVIVAITFGVTLQQQQDPVRQDPEITTQSTTERTRSSVSSTGYTVYPGKEDTSPLWKPDPLGRLEQALQSQNVSAIVAAIDPAGNCPECLERIAAFIMDPLQDEDFKISLMKALMQSETRERTLLLVNVIMSVHLAEQYDLKERLLQLLADVHTTESSQALMTVVTGETTDVDFHQMPEDLQYAIRKAIRLTPDYRATGQMLAESFGSQTSAEAAEALQQIQQPIMTSLLAQEAYRSSDLEKAQEFTNLLSAMDDPRTIEGFMLLGREENVSLDEMTTMANLWARNHSDQYYMDYAEAYLTDPNGDVAQRSIAAFALAASQDSKTALTVLQKVKDEESNPILRAYLDSAIALVMEQSSASAPAE